MREATVRLTLENVSAFERDGLTEDLERFLKSADPTAKTSRLSPRMVTPDAGIILEIVLNAAALTVLAQGIANWLSNRQTAEISVVHEILTRSLRDVCSKDYDAAAIDHWCVARGPKQIEEW